MEVKERMRTEAELERLNRMMEKFDKKKAGLSSDYRYIVTYYSLVLSRILATLDLEGKNAISVVFL